MSIVLNLPMPKNCWSCRYSRLLTNECPCALGYVSSSDYNDVRHIACPIKEISDNIDKV